MRTLLAGAAAVAATLTLPGTAHAQNPLDGFSVNSEQMQAFTRACVHLPSEKEIQNEIEKWTQDQKENSDRQFSIILDGFPLQKITQSEFEALRTLTIPREAHGLLKDQYRFSLKVENKVAVIERACISKACRKDGLDKKFDLSSFHKKDAPTCKNTLCAAQHIFGHTKGLLILWAYLKFGTNLSPLSDLNADPKGLSLESLKAILAAAMLVPEHLKKVALQSSGFFRYRKGTTLSFYEGRKVVANSFGGVFDPIDHLSFTEKIYFFVHELAHRARLIRQPALDESSDWMKVAGWKNESQPQDQVNKGAWVSKYARANAFEDFAETYSLYRLDPERLKKASEAKYEFMRDHVFEGIEYSKNLCSGAKEKLLDLGRIDRHGVAATRVN